MDEHFSYAVGTVDWRTVFRQTTAASRSWANGFFQHNKITSGVCRSCLEDHLLVGCEAGTFFIYDTTTNEIIFQQRTLSSSICPVATCSEIAAYADDSDVHLISLKPPFNELATSVISGSVEGMHFIGGFLYVVTGDSIVALNSADGTRGSSLPLPNHRGVNCTAANDQYLAVGFQKGLILIVALPRLEVILEETRATVGILDIACSGDVVVTGGDGNELILWDMRARKERWTENTAIFGPGCIAVTENTLVTSQSSSSITIRSLDTGMVMYTGRGHHSWCNAVATDGYRIVSGSNDAFVRVWNMEAEEMYLLDPRVDAVLRVCFNTRGIAVDGERGTAWLQFMPNQ